MSRTDSFLFSPSVTINYETEGCGPIPVLLLHGFAAAIATWFDLRRLFPPERFTLYIPDLLGFGASSRPTDASYDIFEHAAIMESFIATLKLENLVLVGHSFGGGVALCLAVQEARKKAGTIARLVLIDCAAYPQETPLFLIVLRNAFLCWLILSLLPKRFIARYSLESIFVNRAAVTPERIDRYLSAYRGSGIARAFNRTARKLDPAHYLDLIDGYSGINLPTLIVWGANDPLISPVMGGRLKNEIAGAELAVIPACGHNPHEERPDETFAAIGRFLSLP